MGMLSEIGLVRSESSKTGRIFEQIMGNFFRISASSSHGYIQTCWQKYQETHAQEDVGTNGKFFELCIATLLVRQDILPFYMQAKIAFVPNIDYDFIMYTLDSGPICISTKTTLRERYKQADLEAVALKYVHRKAKSYLINISEVENRSLQHKIENGDAMGLDGSIYAFSTEFDKFIAQLKKRSLAIAPEVRVVTSDTIITKENVERASNG